MTISYDKRREHLKSMADYITKLREVEEKYYDLIMCVSEKFEGETRHETARRYILQVDQRSEKYGGQALEEIKK